MNKIRTLALVVLVALALASCGSDAVTATTPPGQDGSSNDDGQSDAAGGPDGEWVLDFLLIEGDMAIPLPEAPVDLRIAGSDIGGSAGCNSLGGNASFLADGSINMGDLFWTEMACEETSLMEFEATYTQALLNVDMWTLDDGRLVFEGSTAEITYIPRVAPPDAPIVGTTWQLDTFFDGDTAMNQVGMDAVSVTFSDAGVRASGECWTIDGFATIEPGGEGNLSVDFTSSDPGFSCEGREFFEQMIDRLSQVQDYTIDESRLTLGGATGPILGFTQSS